MSWRRPIYIAGAETTVAELVAATLVAGVLLFALWEVLVLLTAVVPPVGLDDMELRQ